MSAVCLSFHKTCYERKIMWCISEEQILCAEHSTEATVLVQLQLRSANRKVLLLISAF